MRLSLMAPAIAKMEEGIALLVDKDTEIDFVKVYAKIERATELRAVLLFFLGFPDLQSCPFSLNCFSCL